MTSYIIIWTLFVLYLIPGICSMDQRCFLPGISELEGITQHGDITIGVLLPIHVDKIYQKLAFNERPPKTMCALFSQDYYHLFQTLVFAVEEINKNANILPNITLGFKVFDTCSIPHSELHGALQFLSESNSAVANYRCRQKSLYAAVIGSVFSSNSIALANVMGVLRYPQISPLSSVSLLSDRIMFPTFFRTVASDLAQSKELAKLVLHFGWTWVGLLAANNDYGQQGILPIKQEIIKAGVCVAFTEYIILGHSDRNAPHIVKVIKESTVKVIIVFSLDVDLVPIMNEMLNQNVEGRVFIANAGWSKTTLFLMGKYFPTISGTVGLGTSYRVIPGLNDFLDKTQPSTSLGQSWVKQFWEKVFSCKFIEGNSTNPSESSVKACTGKETIEGIRNTSSYITSLKYTHSFYAAVNVVAKSLEDLRNCRGVEGSLSFATCANIWNFKPWQLLRYIKNVKVTLTSGREIYFDEQGGLPAVYDIVNWQMAPEGSMQSIKVGSYDTASLGQAMNINSSLLLWAMGDKEVPRSVCSESCPPGFRKTAKTGQPVCCFECVQCLQGEISNQTDSIDCFKCPWDQWPNFQKTGCLPKDIEFLSYMDLLGTSLSAVSIISSFTPAFILKLFIQHKHTPIVKANNYSLSCLLLVSLFFCFLCSLVFIGYPQPEKCLLRQALFGLVFAICVSCMLSKTIMVVLAFMATRPGSSLRKWTTPQVSYMIILICFLKQFILCLTWLSVSPPFPEKNIQTKPGVIIIECNEGSPTAFWTMLGYLFLLATISFVVAFLARKLPDSFNEAQFITFSMLAFLSVWVSFIPASLSSQGKYTVSMEIFAILASSWALVICMFLPKCFIILYRPEMNSKEFLMKKNKPQERTTR